MTTHENRFLIDANILLNASFIENSFSRRCIDSLRNRGSSILIDDTIFCEVINKIKRLCLFLGKKHSYFVDYVEKYIEFNKIIILLPGDIIELKHLKKAKHDAHVVRAALHYDIALITNDVTLIAECLDEHVSAHFPEDLLYKIAPEEKQKDERIRDKPDPRTISRLRREKGIIFGRVKPGHWLQASGKGHFTFVDLPGIGALYYNNTSRAWEFSMDIGKSICLDFDFREEGIWSICAQYRFSKNRNIIKLYSGISPDVTRSSTGQTLKNRIDTFDPRSSTIGHDRTMSNHWNGPIMQVMFGSEWISERHWKALLKMPGTMPKFSEGDRLIAALKRL